MTGVELDVFDSDPVEVCGWKNGCCVSPPGDGVFVIWKGAKRIGGKDILALVFAQVHRWSLTCVRD